MKPSLINNRSVGGRLAAGFCCLVAMLIGIAILNGLEFHRMGERVRQIVEVNNAKSALARKMLNQIDRLATQVRSIPLMTDLKDIDAEAKAVKLAEQTYSQVEKELQSMLASSGATIQERKLLEEVVEIGRRTVPLLRLAAKQGEAGANMEAAVTLTLQVQPNELIWRKKVSELIALEEDASRQAYAASMEDRRNALAMAAGVVVLAVGGGAFLGWRITRSVKQPIDRAIGVAERIAEGDLTSAVEVTSQDEIGRLLQAISCMQDRLRELVGGIRESARSIQSASAEVASGNRDLSQRTEVAASNLQQTASSVEQLTGTVRQSAESAAQANQLASSASRVASHGGEVVSRVVSTMDEINASSKRIADIIGVIDGIAFQTNILALNAAVEAARAGEQGRGFAVVAGEVRSLAQRSAEAAKEIKTLIGTSVDRVEAGSRLVKDAGATMSEILVSVQRVTDIIGEISAASAEQSSGIGQVNVTVTQLDQMTQQNATLVEHGAGAAENLKDQALRLSAVVSRFRLGRDIQAGARS
ncbi:MAG TPA: methyl-accepting chemotaxis protein [Burkholderiaceae bacterium]|nr:methyl-accepting chemotaxis protein [Burkholderiaceae bacterium]